MPFCDVCCCKGKSTKCRMISVGITSVFLLLLGGFLLYIYYSIFYAVVKQQTELREGTIIYAEWVEPSQIVNVGFFFMNITNAEEFASQTPDKYVKPILEQKGPYVYRTSIVKDRLEPLDTSPKEIRYRQKFNFYYDEELTVGSKDDMITTINFFALALGPTLDHLFRQPEAENITSAQRRAAYLAINRIIENSNATLVMTYPAGDLLFEMQDPLLTALVEAVNGVLNQTSLAHLYPLSDVFGLFRVLNGSDGWHTYQAYTGDPEYSLTNMITMVDNETELHYWFGDKCNVINGSDGTIRSPLSKREDLVYHFYPSACRSTYVKYVKDVTVKKIPAWEYRAPPEMFKAASTSEYNKCFCEEGSTEPYCIHDGAQYLAQCLYGAPLMLSAPHFQHEDGFYSSKLVGMQPDADEHETIYIYEPNTGAAVQASKRLQFNLYVTPNDYIDISQKIGETFAFPIMWVNGTYTVNDDDAVLIYWAVAGAKIIIICLQVAILVTGAALLAYLIIYYYSDRRRMLSLTDENKPAEKTEKVYEFVNGAYLQEKECSTKF